MFHLLGFGLPSARRACFMRIVILLSCMCNWSSGTVTLVWSAAVQQLVGAVVAGHTAVVVCATPSAGAVRVGVQQLEQWSRHSLLLRSRVSHFIRAIRQLLSQSYVNPLICKPSYFGYYQNTHVIDVYPF